MTTIEQVQRESMNTFERIGWFEQQVTELLARLGETPPKEEGDSGRSYWLQKNFQAVHQKDRRGSVVTGLKFAFCQCDSPATLGSRGIMLLAGFIDNARKIVEEVEEVDRKSR